MAPKKNYTPQQMGLAIEAVRKGLKISEAAKKFNVPRITLNNKITGKSPIECSMGPSTVLTKHEEAILEAWIIDMANKHIPINKEELLDSVQRIIMDKKQVTPFTNNRPGKKWYSSFLKRHPTIAERTAQNLSTARDNVTQEDIEKWFSVVEGDLKSRGLVEVLKNPKRIFNTDESAFFLNPKPGRILAKKGDKNVYAAAGDDKENLTVLVTGNAAGDLAPTLVVFNYARIPSSISETFPDDWAIGRSESGWMCAGTFYEYVSNVFNPWLINKNIEKPILFFLDGHKSHLTLHLSNFCSDNGIEVIALNPNSTHILQPMDLAVFRPLKSSWREAVKTWKMQNLGQVLKKHHFAPLLKTAIAKLSVETVKSGFRAGGLYPFGPEYIDMSKIKLQNRQISTEQSDFLKTLENKIETTLSSNKLKLFKDLFYKSRVELENLLPNEDISLYLIWASSKNILDHNVGTETLAESTDSAKNSSLLSGINNQRANASPEEHESVAALSPNTNNSKPNIPFQNILCLNTSNEPKEDRTDLQIIDKIIDVPKSSEKTPNKIIPSTSNNYVIPSPFKRTLFWPDNDESTKNKKRKLKEKFPFTITSPAWKAYNTKKEEEKKRQIEEKELRAKKREEKKLEKLNNMKKKVSKKQKDRSDSSDVDETEIIYAESDESDLSEDAESDDAPLSSLVFFGKKQSKGSYVIVLYEGQHFPGIIENINKNEFEVSTMTFSTGNTYKWPEKPDKMWYQRKDIVEYIHPPTLINKRGFYSVKEMEKYSVFTS